MAVTEEQVREALKQVIDPELGFDIVNLGLVYNIAIDDDKVFIDMTLTTPACMLGPMLTEQAKAAVEALDGVEQAFVNLVWEPRWSQDMMSEELKLMFRYGMFN